MRPHDPHPDDDLWTDPEPNTHSSAPERATTKQYLMFSVSGLQLAAALASVSEIVPYEHVSPVPGMPAFVRGVVHVRERVIPVVDLAHKLGLRGGAAPKRTSILLLDLELGAQRLPMGVVMDDVASLLEVEISRIKPAPRVGAQIAVEYIEGLLPTERGMLPLLDFRRVFGAAEFEQVAATSAYAADSVQCVANSNANPPLTAAGDE